MRVSGAAPGYLNPGSRSGLAWIAQESDRVHSIDGSSVARAGRGTVPESEGERAGFPNVEWGLKAGAGSA